MLLAAVLIAFGSGERSERPAAYLGFDRNDYPGDENLQSLRRSFSYCGYWLNAPPGESQTSWAGKRDVLLRAGFGFTVLFNGRTAAQIKNGGDADAQGKADAIVAVSDGRKEGFPLKTVIFLDQEEGGRLLPEQNRYLFAWIDRVATSGFRAGVYCSAVPFKEASGSVVVTAEDIRRHAGGRQISFWVANDSCPPSPGCSLGKRVPAPSASGVEFASIWQFAQSPKRATVAVGCGKSYAPDGNCYPPMADPKQHMFVDLDSATCRDPSQGRGSR
ncbi:MAG: DUF1906 domain-containing protein [Acidobacteria bacterium]|nr:DUF1906 domain-containing protein [Acidobacteriota bacterium]